MCEDFDSDATYCSVMEQIDTKKKNLKMNQTKLSNSTSLLDFMEKIQWHLNKKRLLSSYEVESFMKHISKMKLKTKKDKCTAEEIKLSFYSIHKAIKSFEYETSKSEDPILNCGISQDLEMLRTKENAFSTQIPVIFDDQQPNESFKTYMLSNQLFVDNYTQNLQMSEISPVLTRDPLISDFLAREGTSDPNFCTSTETISNKETDTTISNSVSSRTVQDNLNYSYDLFLTQGESSGVIDFNNSEILSQENETQNINSSFIISENMDLDLDSGSDLFKKPSFILKRKSKVKSSSLKPTQINNTSLPINKSIPDSNYLINYEDLCYQTKNFLNIIDETSDVTKKLENIVGKDFQKVSELSKLLTKSYNKKINNLIYNVGSGAETWENIAKTFKETTQMRQEICDSLQDILENITNEEMKNNSIDFLNDLENRVTNCLDPKDATEIDVKNLVQTNVNYLQKVSKEFKREFVLEEFKSDSVTEDSEEDLSYFDWRLI